MSLYRLRNGDNYIQIHPRIVSVYDQELQQSQTKDKPMTPRGRATQQSRDTRKTY